MKILVFDNYDSFTYNLVQLIREIAPMASLEVHRNNETALEDIKAFDKILLESDETNYKKVQKKVISDLKLNTRLIATFGAGIGALYPIVENLMRNLSISSIQITPESITLLTIASVTISYLE